MDNFLNGEFSMTETNDTSMENWVRNMGISASSKELIHNREHLQELLDN